MSKHAKIVPMQMQGRRYRNENRKSPNSTSNQTYVPYHVVKYLVKLVVGSDRRDKPVV